MGFYKKSEEETLLEGPNKVLNKNFELYKEEKDNYEYPVDGWYWFDTREEALSFFEIIEENLEENNE